MHRVVIAGSRHRGWVDKLPYAQQEGSEADRHLVVELIEGLKQKHPDLMLISIGCDVGFGRLVKNVASFLQVPCVEFVIKFSDNVPKEQYEFLYLARHAALLDIGDEFHVFVVRSRFSNVEDLVQRLKGTARPHKVYGEEGDTLHAEGL